MIYEFKCTKCGKVFERNMTSDSVLFDSENMKDFTFCSCGSAAEKQFHATSNVFIPAYFHTSKSDIFTDKEWQDLKKNPNIERAK